MSSLNTNSRFALAPHANIKRSRFPIEYSHKTTGNAGYLIPFMWQEILPGDTFSVNTSFLARMQTLITPLMDDLYADVTYFFVPNRLLWKNWQRFMGESDEPWYDDTVYSVPQFRFNIGDVQSNASLKPGSLADYLGLPTTDQDAQTTSSYVSVSHLPIRAYCRIWNDWYRNENTQGLTTFNTEDESVTADVTQQDAWHGQYLLKANKYRDYFTSALPQPQKGPEVTIGVGASAPVFTSVNNNSFEELSQGASAIQPLRFVDRTSGNAVGTSWQELWVKNDNTVAGNPTSTLPTDRVAVVPGNLMADISAATGISINELRTAFATQRYYERMALSGSRYIEILESLFGVTSPDSRLQRSEFLGGHRIGININQVTQNSETSTTPLGNLGAYSLTTDSQHSFTHSFVEHGILMGLVCVRYKHSYQQGINKQWLRRDKFDYFNPIMANIGEQPILKKEIYATGKSTDDDVFGYQEAWAEYRYGSSNMVTGEFRSNFAQTLDSWHLADYYLSAPSLSAEWSQEEGAVVDRAIAVSSRVNHQFMFDFFIDIDATRPMPLYSVPGLQTL